MSETTISLRDAPSKGRIYGYFVLALFSFLLVSTTAVAQEYRSGWDIVESGTNNDLFSVEATEDEIWAFGEDGVVLGSQDGGLSWSHANVITSSDLSMSDSGFGSILAASSDGTVIIKLESTSQWADISFEIGEESISGVSLVRNNSVIAVGSNGSIWKLSLIHI